MVTIAHTVDAKDRYARRHSLRVALYCRGIAAKLGYSDKEKEELYYIALLHDIGKVSTPDTILNKASELTKEEYENVKNTPKSVHRLCRIRDLFRDLRKV